MYFPRSLGEEFYGKERPRTEHNRTDQTIRYNTIQYDTIRYQKHVTKKLQSRFGDEGLLPAFSTSTVMPETLNLLFKEPVTINMRTLKSNRGSEHYKSETLPENSPRSRRSLSPHSPREIRGSRNKEEQARNSFSTRSRSQDDSRRTSPRKTE